MAAVLACGEGACLSHRSAGALYGICEERWGLVETSIRRRGKIKRPAIKGPDPGGARTAFLPLAREVGLSLPLTGEWLNGFEVDFFWPGLKLVVETDGLHYHRTPSAQAKDLERDQAHTAAGYTRLRFSHWQVKHERDYVKRILGETAARLA